MESDWEQESLGTRPDLEIDGEISVRKRHEVECSHIASDGTCFSLSIDSSQRTQALWWLTPDIDCHVSAVQECTDVDQVVI